MTAFATAIQNVGAERLHTSIDQEKEIGMDIKVPDSISNEDLRPIAMANFRAGGVIRDLPSLIGISEERAEQYIEWLRERTQRRFPDRRYPILIPDTSPTSYISFERALNLRVADEPTGDWHFEESFFGYPEPTYIPLAGENGLIDTVPALGSLGVREMGHTIAWKEIKPYDGPVWVANHYRAIADISMDELLGERPDLVLPACQVADWLWSDEDFDILVRDYLKPLRRLVRGRLREAFDAWLPTVVPDAWYSGTLSGASRAPDVGSAEASSASRPGAEGWKCPSVRVWSRASHHGLGL